VNSSQKITGRPKKQTRQLPNSTWAEIRTAHASGIGLREIARNMGIPAGTVLARAKREGWTQQIQEARALGNRAGRESVPVATAAAQTMAERGLRHVERVAGIVERTLPTLESMEPTALLDRVEDFDRLDKVARRTYGLRDGEASANAVVNIALLGVSPELFVVTPSQSTSGLE